MRALVLSAWIAVAPGVTQAQSSDASANRSEDLAQAERAFVEGRFDDARRVFEELLQTPIEEPAALARVYLHLGILAAIGDSMDEAGRRFAAALAIDPTITAPEELPPEQLRAFVAARDIQGGERLTILAQPREPVRAGQPVTVDLAVEHAPPGLVSGYRVVSLGDSDYSERTPGADASATIPAYLWSAGTLSLRVEALNDAGAVLSRRRLVLETPVDPDAVGGDDGGLLASPWFWTGVGAAVAAVVVTVVVVVAVSADPDLVVGPPIGPE